MTGGHPRTGTVPVTLAGAGIEIVPIDAAAWHRWSDDDRRAWVRHLATAAAARTGAPVRATVHWHTPLSLAPTVHGSESRTWTVTAQPAP